MMIVDVYRHDGQEHHFEDVTSYIQIGSFLCVKFGEGKEVGINIADIRSFVAQTDPVGNEASSGD
jgi:hypothetical protein